MRYKCPKCGLEYELGEEYYGQKVQCQCGEKFDVEAPADPAPAADAAPAPEPAPAKSGEAEGPGDFLPAAIIRIECLFIVVGGLFLAAMTTGKSSERLGAVLAIGTIVIGLIFAAPALCFAEMADSLHKIAWYKRREYEEKQAAKKAESSEKDGPA